MYPYNIWDIFLIKSTHYLSYIQIQIGALILIGSTEKEERVKWDSNNVLES